MGQFGVVRGRVVRINGQEISREDQAREDDLRRELNFTWSATLPESNDILAGRWWTEERPAVNEFSMEQNMAENLGVSVGDTMTFSVGGQSFEAALTSIRSVDWDSLNPNFFIIFPRHVIEPYPQTWMTSIFIERSNKLLVNDLLKAYPTILVIALDEIFSRIRILINRVSQGLELMLLLVLACGVLVLSAAIGATFDERMQESAVLRTLGSSQKLILGTLSVEFLTLGLIAGIVASICAEGVIMMLQHFVFEMELSLNPVL